MSQTIRVAAIQLDCEPNAAATNLAKAANLVHQAASRGAKLVLLPELTPNGFRMTEEMWDSAEPFSGRATNWLCDTAKAASVHLGMTFLEADGEHFYNTFALASQSGHTLGRVRKSPPSGPEAFFYSAGNDRHYIDSDIGRVGVGICYENFLHTRINEMHGLSVAIVLQPFSAPTPIPRFPFRRQDVQIFDATMRAQPAHCARVLGVPVVMANRCGPFVSPMPGLLPSWSSKFPGLSTIVDGNGVVQGQLSDEEGVLVADVLLDPHRKVVAQPEAHGRWAMPVPWWYVALPFIQRRGERSYGSSKARRQRALLVSQSMSGRGHG